MCIGDFETITIRSAKKSKLTQKDIDELDRLVRRGVAKSHGL